MSFFMKKPVVIEARQVNSMDYDECCEIMKWCDGYIAPFDSTEDHDGMFYISTLESQSFLVRAGDWVIKGVKGEFYACKPDIFELTYEEVSNETTS